MSRIWAGPGCRSGGTISSPLPRIATLSLAALRLLRAGPDKGRSLALRRYILGLALVALTAPRSAYLRQGCNLVPDPEKPRSVQVVHPDGTRADLTVSDTEAIAFARAAAAEFGIGDSREVPFDKDLADRDMRGERAVTATATAPAGRGRGGRRGQEPPPEVS